LLVAGGAVGGYAVSRDSVVDHLERPREVVYREALAVARTLGQVTLEAPRQGVIQARIEEVNVKVTVRSLTEHVVELKIRARNKFLMPRVDVAQKVYARIKERL
jgi:ribosomal protein L15E